MGYCLSNSFILDVAKKLSHRNNQPTLTMLSSWITGRHQSPEQYQGLCVYSIPCEYHACSDAVKINIEQELFQLTPNRLKTYWIESNYKTNDHRNILLFLKWCHERLGEKQRLSKR